MVILHFVMGSNTTNILPFEESKKDIYITRESPPPSCPVARNTCDKPGTSPITGFPSGTETGKNIIKSFLYVNNMLQLQYRILITNNILLFYTLQDLQTYCMGAILLSLSSYE